MFTMYSSSVQNMSVQKNLRFTFTKVYARHVNASCSSVGTKHYKIAYILLARPSTEYD